MDQVKISIPAKLSSSVNDGFLVTDQNQFFVLALCVAIIENVGSQRSRHSRISKATRVASVFSILRTKVFASTNHGPG